MEKAEKARKLAEKARDQAEQNGYNIGMMKTEEALRAKVPGVCRTYCSQVWIEALNQAGVEALSVLRKADRVYYPLTIRESIPSSSRTDTTSEVAMAGKDSTANVSTSSDRSAEEAEQFGVTKKDKNTN